MKIKLFITLVWCLICAVNIWAQKTEADPQQKKRVLSFAKPEQMFELLEGRWIYMEIDCAKAFAIQVSPDRKTLRLIYPGSAGKEEREYIFNVSAVGKYYIRGRYAGDKRLTEGGKPQIWDFMFISADKFVWHRTDWKDFGITPPATRCKEDKQTAFLR